MSSESDPDEFYDAQEASSPKPSETRFKDENTFEADKAKVVAEEDPFELEIVAEEKRLLEEKRAAEERRRIEDEELQRKLAELERRKILEAEKKEAARRSQENEVRRRKLVDMRMMMEEESTPNRAPPKPPRIIEGGTVDSNQTGTQDDGNLDIIIPPGSPSSQPKGSSMERESLKKQGLGRSQSQNSADLYEDAPSQTGSPEPYVDCDNRNVLNVNAPSIHSDKLQHKNITCETKSPSEESPNIGLLSNSSTMESINVNVLFNQEPDIIQSVKSSSLPRPSNQIPKPAQPVAPPRKKKKNKTPLTAGQDDSEESIPQAVEAEDQLEPDFVSELETPTSTVYNLTRDLERSLSMPGGDELGREKLDITSATRGHRMVTAVEDESARGDSLERLKSANAVLVAQGQSEAQMESDNVTNASREHQRIVFTTETGEPLELAISNTASTESFLIPGVRDANQTPIHMQRPRSNSGSRYLTDKEILEQVTVLNLDTGEQVPLSLAEDKLPRCINPLSLHIMRRTKEYSSDSSLHKYMHDQSDDESIKDGASGNEPKTSRTAKTKKRGKKLKKFIGKTVSRIKSNFQHGEENSSDEDEIADGRRMIKVKASHSHKGPYDFDLLVPVQDMKGDQEGAVWTMKFSHCGRLLATGGQDNLMRVWVLKESYTYFDDMRQKYSEATKVSPAPSQESLNSQAESVISETSLNEPPNEDDEHAPFMKKPFCIYKGHTADLLDISWSKNYFILSSSMDKTVRLWHVSRKECLCCFQHIDFVTAIAFHPKDDRYFLSGSLDGKLRLWNIPDKKVALWNEVSGQNKMITAANFCLNGRFAVVGTYDGRCIFYSTDQLKYYTQIHVRSTRGKNARGRKITGVEPYPGEDKVLVTSNDSRIRLYDLRDLTLTCKYKGCANNSSQIKASFSHDGKYIICGSEDRFVYIWRTQHEFYQIFSSARRDRNDFWEGIKAHAATVTVAVFAPNPHLIIKPQFQQVDPDDQDTMGVRGEVLISADYTGAVKVFINKFKPGSG